MPDDIDRAQAHDQMHRDIALLEHRAARAPADPPLVDVEGRVLCWSCEQPIELARLAVVPNARRCVECQDDHDWFARHGNGG